MIEISSLFKRFGDFTAVRSLDLVHFVLAALDRRTGSALAPRYVERLAKDPP
jgi:hypothetical protein